MADSGTKSKAKRGRPLKIKTPEEMERLTQEYVDICTETDKRLTLTGILLHLGLYTRQSLTDYERRRGFYRPVKRIRALVAAEYEQNLHGSSAAGSIFALKNMGWSDTQTFANDPNNPLPAPQIIVQPVKSSE